MGKREFYIEVRYRHQDSRKKDFGKIVTEDDSWLTYIKPLLNEGIQFVSTTIKFKGMTLMVTTEFDKGELDFDVTCSVCKGRGEIIDQEGILHMESYIDCPVCEGSGAREDDKTNQGNVNLVESDDKDTFASLGVQTYWEGAETGRVVTESSNITEVERVDYKVAVGMTLDEVTALVESLPTETERIVRKSVFFSASSVSYVPCRSDHCYEPRYETGFTSYCVEHLKD